MLLIKRMFVVKQLNLKYFEISKYFIVFDTVFLTVYLDCMKYRNISS